MCCRAVSSDGTLNRLSGLTVSNFNRSSSFTDKALAGFGADSLALVEDAFDVSGVAFLGVAFAFGFFEAAVTGLVAASWPESDLAFAFFFFEVDFNRLFFPIKTSLRSL